MTTNSVPPLQAFGKLASPSRWRQMQYFTLLRLDEYLPKPKIRAKQLKWEDDLELRSKFLDRRVS